MNITEELERKEIQELGWEIAFAGIGSPAPFDLSLKQPLTDWHARYLRRYLVLKEETALNLHGVDPAHVQAVLDGIEKPNNALMVALYPDPEEREIQDRRDTDSWPDGCELTNEEKASTSLCVRDAFLLTQAPGGIGPGDDGLTHHLGYALMEHGALEDIHDVSAEEYGVIFLAGVIWGQRNMAGPPK